MAILLAYLPMVATMLVLVGVERLAGAPKTDWRINLQTWALDLCVQLSGLTALLAWHGPSLIDPAILPAWAAIAIYVLVFDFGEWTFHRLQHTVPLLWAMHSLHHSDPEMSALTTNRHFWGDRLIKAVTVLPLCALVIAPMPQAIAVYAAISLWNFLTHARLPLDLGRWSWLINSPAYHRRHHSCLPEHYNSNFAALFPIWDVLTGAYQRPEGFPPTGLEARPHSLRDLIVWPASYRRMEAAAPAT